MEQVQDFEQGLVVRLGEIEIFENEFEQAIAEACEQFGIEDLVKEKQRRWKAVLQFVGKRVFPDRSILKSNELNIYINNKIPTNNNKYNSDAVNTICDYYIYLSNLYNKFVSAEGFSYFINIPVNTIDQWREAEPSTERYQIWKKLQKHRLESLKDDALDNGNVTGTIAVGNWEYNLNMPGVHQESLHKRVLSAQELLFQLQNNRKLSDNSPKTDCESG